jgi:hypothetical protein
MTNESAKFLLSAYRPNGTDAHDPVFKEALEQAPCDPELATWFRGRPSLLGRGDLSKALVRLTLTAVRCHGAALSRP